MGAEEQTEGAGNWGYFGGRGNREHDPGAPWSAVASHHTVFLYLFGLVHIVEKEPRCTIASPFHSLAPFSQGIPGTKSPFFPLWWILKSPSSS